ncbi:MAG TPA: hypothetical protein VFC51_10835 [Chloroflexota bacterium]|nr:hypothetical protein [Chloroflexota bacterium]
MMTIYLSGGQEIEIEGAEEIKVEYGERFPGTEDPTLICVGKDDIPLAQFRACAVLGFRQKADVR